MPEGRSSVTPPGEMPTYVNTQHINMETLQALQAEAEHLLSRTTESTKDSSPGKDLFDMTAGAAVAEELSTEPWYQGEMTRKDAEQLLKKCGDFLVRKSTSNPGSYVLTGLHNGQAKHLLLVDPEGTVRTKDRIFDSISHLINHHLENNLPIVSSGSELCLHQPAEKKQ
ncbi:hypothetical protein JD844_009034 [Phrynosoma platyrhinos]|uniref:SH2 domain-containing protein n=1 Tax=Phrynosoma platyrhinos TaxID=52577 RepID=A0ABQ7TEL1_PHRPL|nr:hypothetical protein JD844_009034 [Phrynosoma platyrhinos]